MALIRDKNGILVKGATILISKECPSWNYANENYHYHGIAITIGRRLTRMRKANLIMKVEREGREFYVPKSY